MKIESGFPDRSASGCQTDHSKNVVDSLPCRHRRHGLPSSL